MSERLPITTILTAIGNHEGKALTYLAMDPHDDYGITDIHRRFMAIQGPEPAFVGTVTLQQKYLCFSYAPNGLAEEVDDVRGRLRHRKLDPGGVPTALAGHLLAATEGRDVTLAQLFGKAANTGSEKFAPATYRLALLRGLRDTDGPIHEAELGRRAGVPDVSVGTIATTYAKAGLVRFKTAATYKMKSRYEMRGPITTFSFHSHGGARKGALKEAAAYLNARYADHPGTIMTFTRDEVEEHLRTLPSHASAVALRDHLNAILKRLVTLSPIRPIEAYFGQNQHTVIEVVDEQRPFLRRLVDGIDLIEAGDPDAIAEGTSLAAQIVASPTRVVPLIHRSYSTNRAVTNPIPRAEKERRILSALGAEEGVTSEHLLSLLSPDLNKASVSGTLSGLAREGRIHGVKQPDGPYKLWYLGPGSPA